MVLTSSPARTLILVLVLWAAGLGAAAQFAKVSVILPELEAIYPGRGAAIGFLVSLISLLGVALGLVAGLLGARIGLRRLLVAALALGAVVSILQASLPSFPFMLLLRVVEGLSHLGIVVAAPTLIGTLTPPRHQGLAMTLWGTFFGVGFAMTAWLGVPLVQSHGPGVLFLAHASLMALVGIALAVILPIDNISRRPTEVAQSDPQTPGLRALLARHRAAYASPRIAAPALGWFFYTLTFVALLTVLPTLVPAPSRTFVAAAMPLASIAVSMTLGVALLRVLPAVGVVGLGFVAAILFALAFLLTSGSAWLPVLLFGALGLVQGASFAAIPELNARAGDQALANGAMAQLGNAGNLLGTPLLLSVLTVANADAVIVLIIGAYVLGLGTHFLTSRARSRMTAE